MRVNTRKRKAARKEEAEIRGTNKKRGRPKKGTEKESLNMVTPTQYMEATKNKTHSRGCGADLSKYALHSKSVKTAKHPKNVSSVEKTLILIARIAKTTRFSMINLTADHMQEECVTWSIITQCFLVLHEVICQNCSDGQN